MKRTSRNLSAWTATAAAVATLAAGACAGGSSTAGGSAPAGAPAIVQPGAPGEATRPYEGGPVSEIEGTSYTEADIRFMQGMIHHHAQALEMTALVPSRTEDEGFRLMARRMEISQTDEIAIMQDWLRARGEDAPHVGAHGHVPAMMMMPGMLSAEQMERLRNATGVEFERLFLELMIQHHEGAITMVRELFATPGAAQESTVNFFANEVDADQTIEIQRMQSMLRERGP